MTAPMGTALPYGIRDCKLTRYSDASGTTLGSTSIDLPNMQTFSFSETEEFQELRGDDRVVTTRGQGAQVEWEIEAGGISLQAWSVFSGGEILESGLSPNRSVTCRKRGTQPRPYFRMEGQVMSDSGGDVHGIVYRCRANDTIEGEFADGEFFVTSGSGVGLPLLDEDFDLLYDIVQNETPVSIPLTANPNPTGGPQNLTVITASTTATSVELDWDDYTPAPDSYLVQQSTDSGETWSNVSSANGGEPTTSTTTVSGLTAATQYWFQVRAVEGGVQGPPSNMVEATTAAA